MATGNIGKIKASRVNNVPNVESYLGEKGILFYNYANGVIRMSDGITPGGVPVPYTVASASTVGGIKAGPGANISADGTLTIDTGGLPLSIGNIEIANTTISTLNPNTNLNLVTNGASDINIVGNLHVHTTAQGADYPTPILAADNDGNVTTNGNLITNGNTYLVGATTFIGPQTTVGYSRFVGNIVANGFTTFNGATLFNGDVTEVGNITITGTAVNNGRSVFNGDLTITGNTTVTGNSTQTGRSTYIVSTDSMNAGAVEITGNLQGLYQPPVVPGVMLHVTGQDNGTTPGRVYIDSNRQYSILVGRRFDGSIASPTQVLAGEEVFRLAGTGYPTGGWPVTGLAQIRFIADENQTQTNRGGHLDFLTVPTGSNVMTQVMSVSASSGVTVVGNLTAGNVIANTFGSLNVTGNIKYNAVNATGSGFNKTGGSVTANGQTGQVTSNADSLAKGAAGTFTINNNYITNDKDIVIINIGSGGSINSYSATVTRVNAAGFCNVTISNNGTGPLAEALTFNFAIIKVN